MSFKDSQLIGSYNFTKVLDKKKFIFLNKFIHFISNFDYLYVKFIDFTFIF